MNEIGLASAALYRMDWRRSLIIDSKGEPRPLLANALTALRGASEWSGVLAFDEFALRVQTLRATPWGKTPGDQWTDNDDRLTAEWLQREGIPGSPTLAGEAVQTVALEHRFHPVRDYLTSLRWDGVPRIDTWVSVYLGVDPSKTISHEFGRIWLISAVARVMEPGCKADCCLILEGPQGIRKSTSLKVLGTPWFTDQLADIRSKDACMQCHGVWIIEFAELDSIGKSETSRVKAFLSTTADRFRLPYGKHIIEWPRGCVFAGSTNKDDYLRDETGARRFLPITCSTCDVDALARNRDQLWAEALSRYRAGEPWWLSERQLIADAEGEQADRFESDAWDDRILAFTAVRPDVSIAEVLTFLGIPEGQWMHAHALRVSRRLKAMKWKRYRASGIERPWRYRRPSA